jgi:hypothetical protein
MPYRLAQLGHDGPPSGGLWDENLITGKPLEICPVRALQLAPAALREEILRWKHEYFPAFQKGWPLVAGGVADQPARYLAAMLYIESLEDRKQEKYLEKTRPDGDGGGA